MAKEEKDVIQTDPTSDKDEAVLTGKTDSTPFNNEDLTPEELELFTMIKGLGAGDEADIMNSDKQLNDMSRSQKKLLRRAENEIVTERGVKLKADTDSSKFQEDAIELVRSFKTNAVLEGIVTGACRISSNSPVPQFYATVAFNNGTFKVLIPSFALFVYNTDGYKSGVLDENVQRQVERYINNMIGSTVQFIAYHVDKKERYAICDRLKALEIIGKQNYLQIQRGDDAPRLTPGMLAAAKVIRVSRESITLCTLGSDCTISSDPDKNGMNEVSWGRPGDCRDLYKPGDEVVVKVLSVDRVPVKMNDKSYMLIKTKVSIRQASSNPLDKYFDEFTEGAHYISTVTSVTDAGVFVNLVDKVPALVAFPKYGAIPERGENRIVMITQKKIDSDGRKLIYGIFVR